MQHLSLLSFPNLLEPLSLRGQSWYNRNSSGFPKQKGQKFLGEMKREDTHLMVRSVWIPTSKKSPNCLAAFSVCSNSNTNTVSHMITCSTTSQNCSFTLLYHYHHCHGQFDSTVFNNIAGNNHCMLKKKWKLTICIRTIHHHLWLTAGKCLALEQSRFPSAIF